MTKPNYQKPPLREEIEAFFKQLKGVIIAIISIITFIAVLFGLCKFTETDMAHQIGNYISEHILAFMFTALIAVLSYAILCGALYRKHLIYKRYRIGYFSRMMWGFIGFFISQLLNIPIVVYMDGLIPIIIIELIAFGFTALALSDYKKNHPPLTRPLTKEENDRRKDIINALLNSYRNGPHTIESDANAFARAGYLMDFQPELFDVLNTVNSGYTIPSMFYSDTLDDSTNKLSVNTEDPRYETYRKRAYWQMTRDQNPDSPFKLCKESFFD